MNYSFTVSKKITPTEKPDYQPIWKLFEENNLTVMYKFAHTADKEVDHLHWHGIFYAKYVDIKKLKLDGYRIQATSQFNPMKWFHYCWHEEKTAKSKLITEIEDLKGRQLLNKVMEAGAPLKQQKLPTLLKISILGEL